MSRAACPPAQRRCERRWATQCALACGVLLAGICPVAADEPTETSLAVRLETPRYDFTPADEQSLDEIQRGCFNFLWRAVGQPGQLTRDRRTTQVASLAGVGFQLAALPIGVERGWITRALGEARALRALRTLRDEPSNRRFGLLLHFVNADDGAIYPSYRNEISTVDTALFLAGGLPAARYFGGEVAELVEQFHRAAEWTQFQRTATGRLSFAWKPDDSGDLAGSGAFMDLEWRRANDEERLLYFIAIGSPQAEQAVEPRVYYALERPVGRTEDGLPLVVSWNGALFTHFFSHCYINYRDLEADDPLQFGVEAPRVDWFENSRRAALAHRATCLRHAAQYATLGPDRWGLSPCMGLRGDPPQWHYIVQDVPPNVSGQTELFEGTVAPYAAGACLMFTPRESLAALREFRQLRGADGQLLVWRDVDDGGYGLRDSFNLDHQAASDDDIAIDAGPLLLAIENARSGLVWRLFMEHPIARRAAERLQWQPRQP